MPIPPQPWRSRFGAEPAATGGEGSGVADGAGDPADPAADDLLEFEPDRLVRAIVYHMLDEGLARKVAEDSVRTAVTRLRRRSVRPSIRRSAWQAMSNHDRLEWLLAESRTVPLLGEGAVVLLGSRDA